MVKTEYYVTTTRTVTRRVTPNEGRLVETGTTSPLVRKTDVHLLGKTARVEMFGEEGK